MAIKIKNINDLTHTEWLELRKNGIGGSDAGAIAGLNPWKSAFSVYLDKTSDEVKEVTDNERMRVGRDLEDYVAKRFEEATGKKVRRNNFMMKSEKYPFMFANVDREVVGENAVLECKTTGSYSKKDWENGVPAHYELQVLHYMLVGGYDKGYIACLIGNESFTWYEIERDEETLEYLVQVEKKFWQDLENGIMPQPDGSSDYDQALMQKYSTTTEQTINLNLEESRIGLLNELKDMKKDTEKKIKTIEQEIKLALAEYESGIAGRYKVTWKKQNSSRLDTKKLQEEKPEIADLYRYTTESRVLRIKGAQ